MRQYVHRSLVAILVLSIVSLAEPVSVRASSADDVTSVPLAPGVLERSIAVEASRAALQEPQTAASDASGGSHTACRTGGALLAGAGAAFAVALVKHAHWESSGATALPGAKPPSSVGVSVSIGAVLAGAGIFTMSRACGG